MKNRILKALPASEYRAISMQLKPVVLSKGGVLYEAGERIRDIYLPEDGLVSYLSGTAEGETLEVGVIGNEGRGNRRRSGRHDGVSGGRTDSRASLQDKARSASQGIQSPGRSSSASASVRQRSRRAGRPNGCLQQVSFRRRTSLPVAAYGPRPLSFGYSPMSQEELARVLGSRRASIKRRLVLTRKSL